MLYPRPKKESIGASHPIALPLRVFCAEATSERYMFVLHEMLPQIEAVTVENAEEANVLISQAPGFFSSNEAYELTVKAGEVRICAKDYPGAVHALATLVQLLHYENGSITVLDAKISDFPDAEFRSFMIDPARHVIPMDELRAQILSMAKAKLNKLHIHLSDSNGFAYETRVNVPMARKGIYSKAELKEIIWYAAQFGIDVIPEIDVPAHGTDLLSLYPSFKCRVKDESGKDVKTSGWCMCLGNEDCYALIDELLAEIAEIFPYEYIHVGTDELDMRDIMEFAERPISHCEDCEQCRAFFAPKGLFTLTERFYWFLNRIYATVTSLGKRMMMWNDSIDISKAPPIPRDILIEFWRVAAEQRGPVEGCSMQRFLEEGFEVVNADFPNTYVDEYVEWSRLKKWDFRKDPADASARPYQVVGGEMCAWEGSNYPHYLYALYFAIPVFGDRLWSSSPIPDTKDATVALTRIALGMDVPRDFDVTEAMKDVPLGTSRFWEGEVFEKTADTQAVSSVLSALKHQSVDEVRLTRELLCRLG